MQIIFHNTKNGKQCQVNLPNDFNLDSEDSLQLTMGIDRYALKCITPKAIRELKNNLTDYVEKNGTRLFEQEFTEFRTTGDLRAYPADEFKKIFVENATKDNAAFLKDKTELLKFGIDVETMGATYYMDWVTYTYGLELEDIYLELNQKAESYPVDYLKRYKALLESSPNLNLRDVLKAIEDIRFDYMKDVRIHCPESILVTPLDPLRLYIEKKSKDDEGTHPDKPLIHDPLRSVNITIQNDDLFAEAVDKTIEQIVIKIHDYESIIYAHKDNLDKRTFITDLQSAHTILGNFVTTVAQHTADVDSIQKQLDKMKPNDPARAFLNVRMTASKDKLKKSLEGILKDWETYKFNLSLLPNTNNYTYQERLYLSDVASIMDRFNKPGQEMLTGQVLGQLVVYLTQVLPQIKQVIDTGKLPEPVEAQA